MKAYHAPDKPTKLITGSSVWSGLTADTDGTWYTDGNYAVRLTYFEIDKLPKSLFDVPVEARPGPIIDYLVPDKQLCAPANYSHIAQTQQDKKYIDIVYYEAIHPAKYIKLAVKRACLNVILSRYPDAIAYALDQYHSLTFYQHSVLSDDCIPIAVGVIMPVLLPDDEED